MESDITGLYGRCPHCNWSIKAKSGESAIVCGSCKNAVDIVAGQFVAPGGAVRPSRGPWRKPGTGEAIATGVVGFIFGGFICLLGLIFCLFCFPLGLILGIVTFVFGLITMFGVPAGAGTPTLSTQCPYCGYNLRVVKGQRSLKCGTCKKRVVVSGDKLIKPE